jgi:5-methylthioadenosine/S-adenosylhomocysteine deaminase
MKVALGSDGAPCNNMMDAFVEMRLAALLQKPLFGPTALPARAAFELATRGGAQVLGVSDQIGSLEVGKRADVVIVERSHPSVATVSDPYSALVYSCSGRDVRDVWIDGRPIVRGKRHQIYDQAQVLSRAKQELKALQERL